MDENFKKDLVEIIDQKFQEVRKTIKGDMVSVFNQGFEELVMPELEAIRSEMATKKDIEGIKGQFESVNRRLDKHAEKIHQLETA